MQLHRGRKKKNRIQKKVKYKSEHIRRGRNNDLPGKIDQKKAKELDSDKKIEKQGVERVD